MDRNSLLGCSKRNWFGQSWFLIGIFLLISCSTSKKNESEYQVMSLNKGKWTFVGGEWEESDKGIFIPPRKPTNEHLAFNTSEAFTDFEAEFEFRWEIQNSGAGFIFRAKNARQYYMVHFPCTGQQYRAEHFWAAISKVDESGWVRFLRMEMVHGVPSEIGLWHKAKLVVKGSTFRLWVDGRPLPVVVDSSYSGPGFVGLESYNARDPDRLTDVGDPVTKIGAGSTFRKMKIRGRKFQGVHWDPESKPLKNWFYPLPETSYGKWQYASSLARSPNGDLLMKLIVAKEHLSKDSVAVLLRSKDNGRNWSKPKKLPGILKGATLFNNRNGQLKMYMIQSSPPFKMYTSSSNDDGKTWSSVKENGQLKFSKNLNVRNAHVGKILELRSGQLMRFGYTVGENQSVHGAIKEENGVRYWGPITEADFSFSISSFDGGKTWSDPVNLNGPNPSPQYFMVAKETGSEVSAAETRQGKILALIRSYTSPWMWETWSEDNGKSWSPAARGPFPMYAATNSMTSSSSGVLVIAGRHPGVGVQVSHDDGMTWQCTRIDTPFYANGVSYEVEPDIILYIYDGKYSDPRVRGQLIRVTPKGIKPVKINQS